MRFITLVLMLVTAGCTPSIEPLYTDRDTAFDPAFLGSWRNTKGKEHFTVARGSDTGYRIEYNDEDGRGVLIARLVPLGDARFVDLYPQKPKAAGFYTAHLIRTHTFGRVWLEGDRLRFAMVDPDWIKKAGRDVRLSRISIDGGPLLNASTKDLRDFAVKYANDSKVFAAVTEWTRQK